MGQIAESSGGNGGCIDFLLQVNEEHSRAFCDPATALKRKQYRANHSTEIGAMKCMDGRLNLSVITDMALGIIQPWRNLGGRFDLGWYGFQMSIREWVAYSIEQGRHILPICTYHFSRGSLRRGCRGFHYSRKEAMDACFKLESQFDIAFGRGVLYTISCGIETDLDALILHGENGEVVDVSEFGEIGEHDLQTLLMGLYPNMPKKILFDFFPLVAGNVRHVASVMASRRPDGEMDHKEDTLALGRGFDWLHLPNKALIVGPFDDDIRGTIITALGLVLDNIRGKRINSEDGIALISSAPYRDLAGYDRRLAEEKAYYLNNLAFYLIKNTEELQALLPYVRRLITVVNIHTRKLDVLWRN